MCFPTDALSCGSMKHGRRPPLQGVSERRACRDTRQHRVPPFASGAWRAWSYSAAGPENCGRRRKVRQGDWADARQSITGSQSLPGEDQGFLADRKNGGLGKSVAVRGVFGGRRKNKKK